MLAHLVHPPRYRAVKTIVFFVRVYKAFRSKTLDRLSWRAFGVSCVLKIFFFAVMGNIGAAFCVVSLRRRSLLSRTAVFLYFLNLFLFSLIVVLV